NTLRVGNYMLIFLHIQVGHHSRIIGQICSFSEFIFIYNIQKTIFPFSSVKGKIVEGIFFRGTVKGLIEILSWVVHFVIRAGFLWLLHKLMVSQITQNGNRDYPDDTNNKTLVPGYPFLRSGSTLV